MNFNFQRHEDSPLGAVTKVALAILGGEFLIMIAIEVVFTPLFGNDIPTKLWKFMDPVLLMFIVAPVLHYSVLKPMRAQQKKLEQQRDDLEILAATFSTQDGVIVTDLNHTILKVNHAFTAVTGYGAEEAIGKTPAMLHSGIQNEDFYRLMRDGLRSNGFWQGEIWNRRKNGEIYPERLTITAVEHGEKECYYVGIFSDISEYKRTENELRLSQEKFSKAFHDSPDAMMITEINTGLVREINKSFTNILGYTEEDVIGHTTTEFGLWPDEGSRNETISIIKSQGFIRNHELKHRTKDGRVLTLLATSTQLHTDGATMLVVHFRDITERKLAEIQLNSLLAFNKAILEESPAGIAVFTESGPCIMANKAYAKTVGATVENILEQDFRKSSSWERNGLLNYADQAVATGMTVRQDIVGTTSFGKQVTLECVFAPVNISGKKHLLLITNDISERVEAENTITESMRKLEEKEMAKTRFLAAAGHDLRQPLTAANLFIDALKLTETTPEQNKIIQRLNQAMSNFNDLLDALLNVSKLDAGVIKPEFTSINVADLFNWLEKSFAPIASDKNLQLKLYFSTRKSLVVRSDIGLIKSILMNLVSNAIKYTSKGKILVSARPLGKTIRFQIWDTGIGIQGENIESIFDDFYQINNPQRDRTRGLGLGLSICKRALALLDGKITCRSQVGRGSVFEFHLPMDKISSNVTQEETTVELQEVEFSRTFSRGKRFVVVEDDALVSEALSKSLEMMGGKVACFDNAEYALQQPDIENADCYIVDYMLNGSVNGINFLNSIQRKTNKPLCAVMISGDTSANFIRKAELFDWPVLHKPVNLSKLITRLSEQYSANV